MSATQILSEFDGRVRFVKNSENKGQICSFYDGVDQTDADFVVLLDPDDRLHPEFCEEMIAIHLNADIYCGQASCNQIFVRNNVMLTGTSGHRRQVGKDVYGVETHYRKVFVGPHLKGWHWPSTSSLVFRRDAVEMIRPRKKLQTMRAADAYLGPLIHMIGGSLYYSRPLVMRNFHSDNSWLPDRIVSRLTTQKGRHRTGDYARIEALDAFFANGGLESMEKDALRLTFKANLNLDQRRALKDMNWDIDSILGSGLTGVNKEGFWHRVRTVRRAVKAKLGFAGKSTKP
jgi:glycosyltransferase involved in cell wall biosynthesis